MALIKRIARLFIPRTTWSRISARRGVVEAAINRVGFSAWIELKIARLLNKATRLVPFRFRWIRRINIKNYDYPIFYRVGGSDVEVIVQVLVRREYEYVAHEHNVSVIIDCGANIGCTSFFFLHRYPKARIVVVEPDGDNFAICRLNLKPFADRVVLVHSGVWPTNTPLRVVKGLYGDGREWSFQVRPASDGEPFNFMGTTISQLIECAGSRTVDLLKIDIESAESRLFAENTEQWLPRTRRVVIELHGAECERVFFECMVQYCSEFERSGELTFCRNETSLALSCE